MHRSIGVVIATAAMIPVLQSLHAQDAAAVTEASWTALSDEASRTSLFDQKIKPAREEADAASSEKPIDLAIPKQFYFPTDVRTDVINNQPRLGVLFGIDISHYTKPSLNKGLLRTQGVRFVYVKATQGVQFKDSQFSFFWGVLHGLEKQQVLSVGAYHFLEAGVSGRDQGKRYVDYVGLHGGFKPGDMPPCLDLEWDSTSSNPDRWTHVTAEETVNTAIDFLQYVEQHTGRRPLVYTAKSWLDDRGIKGDLLARLSAYRIWVADYSVTHKAVERPAVPTGPKPILWQFASDARLTDGYDGGLDANIYYGTEDDFVHDFGLRP